MEAKRAEFFKKVEESEDLNDKLQDLVDHVAENTGATAVYVGKIDKPIKGIKDGLAEDDDEDPIAKAARDQASPLVNWMGELLDSDVAEVRLSSRLTDSPSILVDQEGAMGANMERILRAANQQVGPSAKRVLELNPEHAMVKTLAFLLCPSV